MFPYTFAYLIMVWTAAFFLLQDLYSSEHHYYALFIDAILMLIFIAFAIKYYKVRPKSTSASAAAIAYDLAVIPLLLVNLMSLKCLFKPMNEIGMVYLLPMIYFPPIFVVSFLLILLVKKVMRTRSTPDRY